MIAEIVACQAFKLAYKKKRHWQNYLFDREKMHFGMVGCTNQHVRQDTPRHEIVFFLLSWIQFHHSGILLGNL